jgi:predicted O-methyltransferase YrrM
VPRHLKNVPNQARNSFQAVRVALPGSGMFAELHRSLGWRMITMEGYLRQQQADYFSTFLATIHSVRTILEVGFNAGHSSYIFLNARPDVRVVSFDLGEHRYVPAAKTFIDRKFPGRHELVLGDSKATVPRYQEAYPDSRFDLAFIDGGHDYEVASSDLNNCRNLARGGFVIMDDLLGWTTWGAGPVRAWAEACGTGLVNALQLVQDGRPVESVSQKTATAAWALGRYT